MQSGFPHHTVFQKLGGGRHGNAKNRVPVDWLGDLPDPNVGVACTDSWEGTVRVSAAGSLGPSTVGVPPQPSPEVRSHHLEVIVRGQGAQLLFQLLFGEARGQTPKDDLR